MNHQLLQIEYVPKPLREVEREHVIDALAHGRGNIKRVSKHLKISRMSLYRRMKRYGVDRYGRPLKYDESLSI